MTENQSLAHNLCDAALKLINVILLICCRILIRNGATLNNWYLNVMVLWQLNFASNKVSLLCDIS